MIAGSLPLVISIPHGGTGLPAEAQADCLLTPADFARDGDTWTRELYAFSSQVVSLIETPVPRAIVDMNRAPGDFPPGNPDGVVKTVTVQGKQVWRDPAGPPPGLAERLIRKYHVSYHRRIEQAGRAGGAVLGLDCHSMLARGPLDGLWRPLACLGNLGDQDGEPVDGPTSAPAELVRRLRDALARALAQDQDLNRSGGPAVCLNHPFRGGHITRHHGGRGPLPWIQLELNRILYLPAGADPSPRPGPASTRRLTELSARILSVLGSVL